MSRPKAVLPLERHYTSREAAEIIGSSSGSLRNLRLKNRGPRWVVTAGGTIRYPESALRDYLNGVRQEAA